MVCIIRLSHSIIKYCNLILNVIMTCEGTLEKYYFGYNNGFNIVEDFIIHGLHLLSNIVFNVNELKNHV